MNQEQKLKKITSNLTMGRQEYFDKIKAIHSPLLLLGNSLDIFLNSLSDNEPTIESCIHIAKQLQTFDNNAAQTRAEFILKQCNGNISEDFFFEHCESWGIPKFEEELLLASDFKNGFLHTFRDHSTSWSEDQEAREWFYNHVECRFIKNYEFWACDNGPDEIILKENGNYKAMLWTLVKNHQDYYALVSPEFSFGELQKYAESFNEEDEAIEKEELLEILSNNPNWQIVE